MGKTVVKLNKKKQKTHSVVKKKSVNKSKETKPKKNYVSMSYDDFLENELDHFSDSDEEEENGKNVESDDENETNQEINFGISDQDQKNDNDESESELESDLEQTNEFESHKESLAKLKETDPEFYKFLEENDKKLLDFNASDSEEDEDNEDEDQVHKPSGDLEVASDESDFEPDDEQKVDSRVITLKMLKQWQNDLQTNEKLLDTLNSLTKAFHAALIRVSGDENDFTEYKVDGSSVFNAVVQLCVLELGPALRKFLRLTPGTKQPPHKCKKFPKIKILLRDYFLDLLKLLGGVSSTNILNVLLKHLHYMSPFIISFPNVAKRALKRLIHLWGTADETVRVVAFMSILRITNHQQSTYLATVLKSMYLTYVRNCKFMSKTTLPVINFMRRSLSEMYALDLNVSYEHVFLYIRQLAIHLRNAVTLHKKENVQAVYNWQYVNSLHLWANLLAASCHKPQLQPLVYPLVQIIIGVVKLVPTPQYYPLRFHCLQILVDLSRDAGVFIPVLPFILEVLANFHFKKNSRVSMKPIVFTCLLRLSKSQLQENGFNDAVVESVYGLLLDYLASQSHSISFPDIALFAVLQIKQFLKSCPVTNYSKKMKQILEKIQQNCQFIEDERKRITFTITDTKQIEAWETNVYNKGTPLNTYYENWRKLHLVKKRKQEVTENDTIADYALPSTKKVKKSVTTKKKRDDGPVELFPSDNESGDEDIINKKLNVDVGQKRKKFEKKRKTKNVIINKQIEEDVIIEENQSVDVIQDLNDW